AAVATATMPAPAPARPAPPLTAAPVPAPAPVPAGNGQQRIAAIAPAGSGRFLTSPLVKKIAREENVDLRQVQGTGMGGRVTRIDIMSYVESRKSGVAAPAPAQPRPAAAPAAAAATHAPLAATAAPSPAFEAQVMAGDRVENMSTMRRLIADH